MKPRAVILATLIVPGLAGCGTPQPRLVVGDIKQAFQACEGMSRQQCLLRDPYPPGVIFDYETMTLKP